MCSLRLKAVESTFGAVKAAEQPWTLWGELHCWFSRTHSKRVSRGSKRSAHVSPCLEADFQLMHLSLPGAHTPEMATCCCFFLFCKRPEAESESGVDRKGCGGADNAAAALTMGFRAVSPLCTSAAQCSGMPQEVTCPQTRILLSARVPVGSKQFVYK